MTRDTYENNWEGSSKRVVRAQPKMRTQLSSQCPQDVGRCHTEKQSRPCLGSSSWWVGNIRVNQAER